MTRLYLTRREHDALLDAQAGKCCVSGFKTTAGLIAEHSTPNALKPGKPDQLMCAPCHKVKTLRDVKAIAKTKRLNGTTMSQCERRKKFGSRLRGRGFEKRD
ncbi:MAG: hypothetical protein M0D54_01920 [Hyphomonadaceae bacterium JAD_PAG50586_4]|nr:MAG: hypothetical protein M0D54_01920 [Hyphomonadaceae bacterium JAD_PAG50586_4]